MSRVDGYALVAMYTAARACLKAGVNRSEATLAFMEQYDRAKEAPETRKPPPLVGEAFDNLRKCGEKE